MQQNLNFNMENKIAASEIIYGYGTKVTGIALLLSGKIEKISASEGNNARRTAYEAGSFIAYGDLCCGSYSGDYTAVTDCVIFPLQCQTPAELIKVLDSEHDFIENRRFAFYNYIKQLVMLYNTLFQDSSVFYNGIDTARTKFQDVLTRNSSSAESDFRLALGWKPTSPDNFKLTNLPFYDIYKNLGSTPPSCDDIIKIISDFYKYFSNILSYLNTEIKRAASGNMSLAGLAAKSASSLPADAAGDLRSVIDDIQTAVSALENNVRTYFDFKPDFDRSGLSSYKAALTGMNPEAATESAPADTAVPRADAAELTGIFKKLIIYSSYPKEDASALYNTLETFKKMPDKGAADDNARRLRKTLSDEYYKFYERVFLTYADGDASKAPLYVRLFLDYGLLDETLIDDEWLHNVSAAASVPCGSPCTVFRLKDWLMSIYRGENMPSKNEYDEEYVDYVRKKKKELNLTPEKERELLEDGLLKVQYEINNMFKCNNRLLNGNLACFYPMLNSYSNEQPLTKLELTADAINEGITALTAVDFSAFYRESMYEDLSLGISKETVVREIHPVIILFPIYGINCVMWQEISGKRINNPGRVFMPIFFAGDFPLSIMRLVARFRWELCKTAQGLAWNDVSVPSLTSEYNDYLQFYRKNKELSPEKKEQVKTQLSRCRNNIREAFIYDYCIWIKFECTGAMRLNKVARRIFATYCPFPKNVRDNLEHQPLFAEAMAKFNRERQKKIKELSLHYSALARKGIEMTKELTDTEDFYTKF